MPSTVTVTVPALAVGWLVETAVDHAWYADQADGCCPTCCATCGALALLDPGLLDDLLRHSPGATVSAWWRRDHLGRSGIDPALLPRTWRLTTCHGTDRTADGQPAGQNTTTPVANTGQDKQ